MSSEDEEDWCGMSQLADDENFIVAYPRKYSSNPPVACDLSGAGRVDRLLVIADGNDITTYPAAGLETSTGRGASRPAWASFAAVGCDQRVGPAGQTCDTDWVE